MQLHPAIYCEQGERLKAVLGMNCPGIDRQLEGNRCDLQLNILVEFYMNHIVSHCRCRNRRSLLLIISFSLDFYLLIVGIEGLFFLPDHNETHSDTHTHTLTHTLQVSAGRGIGPSQKPLPLNTQQSQQTNIHTPRGIRTRHDSERAATDRRHRPGDVFFLSLLITHCR